MRSVSGALLFCEAAGTREEGNRRMEPLLERQKYVLHQRCKVKTTFYIQEMLRFACKCIRGYQHAGFFQYVVGFKFSSFSLLCTSFRFIHYTHVFTTLWSCCAHSPVALLWNNRRLLRSPSQSPFAADDCAKLCAISGSFQITPEVWTDGSD